MFQRNQSQKPPVKDQEFTPSTYSTYHTHACTSVLKLIISVPYISYQGYFNLANNVECKFTKVLSHRYWGIAIGHWSYLVQENIHTLIKGRKKAFEIAKKMIKDSCRQWATTPKQNVLKFFVPFLMYPILLGNKTFMYNYIFNKLGHQESMIHNTSCWIQGHRSSSLVSKCHNPWLSPDHTLETWACKTTLYDNTIWAHPVYPSSQYHFCWLIISTACYVYQTDEEDISTA